VLDEWEAIEGPLHSLRADSPDIIWPTRGDTDQRGARSRLTPRYSKPSTARAKARARVLIASYAPVGRPTVSVELENGCSD
jgi:hypothetical protein